MLLPAQQKKGSTYGKRAIRLDAWAVDVNERQFNTEMQNETSGDDVRKRARFYQGMLDTPVLKSGKETRYKNLPSTVIIFITQEDIFGQDIAMYTFTEQCEEVAGLHLDDGTTKIFLNMKSKNGRPELVSLLQYMKNTNLDNPEIVEKDPRIVELDGIVREVTQSEEWEALRMNIYEMGIEKGREEGREEGRECSVRIFVNNLLVKGMSDEDIMQLAECNQSVIDEVRKELSKSED